MNSIYYVGVATIIICIIMFAPSGDNVVGDDVDDHGCLITAGYLYNDYVGACIRHFELNETQMLITKKLIDSLGIKGNATILSVLPHEEVSTLYVITVLYNSERREYMLDVDPYKYDKVENICDDGLVFCADEDRCIDEKIEVCGGASNISEEMCNNSAGNIRSVCFGNETAIANVNNLLCCFGNIETVIIPNSDVCRDACLVISATNGTCSNDCEDCLILGKCSDGGMCTCLQ